MDGSTGAASGDRGSGIEDPEIIVSALSAFSILVSYDSTHALANPIFLTPSAIL